MAHPDATFSLPTAPRAPLLAKIWTTKQLRRSSLTVCLISHVFVIWEDRGLTRKGPRLRYIPQFRPDRHISRLYCHPRWPIHRRRRCTAFCQLHMCNPLCTNRPQHIDRTHYHALRQRAVSKSEYDRGPGRRSTGVFVN